MTQIFMICRKLLLQNTRKICVYQVNLRPIFYLRTQVVKNLIKKASTIVHKGWAKTNGANADTLVISNALSSTQSNKKPSKPTMTISKPLVHVNGRQKKGNPKLRGISTPTAV
jgi:hypothetical protein